MVSELIVNLSRTLNPVGFLELGYKNLEIRESGKNIAYNCPPHVLPCCSPKCCLTELEVKAIVWGQPSVSRLRAGICSFYFLNVGSMIVKHNIRKIY